MMPRLDGLELRHRAARRPAHRRRAGAAAVRAGGQEAAIEGLDAGADDYLVKPFSAAELLARVRTSVQLSRMRGQHARWRAALIESLHEAFFLCGPDGAVLEINSAFADMLGYGPDGLPYPEPHPWWPDQESDPDAYEMAEEACRITREQRAGNFTVPVAHRDGRRLWMAGSFSEVTDQDNGRLVVGTLRDVTAEHYAIQRERALAALGQVLARASSMAGNPAGSARRAAPALARPPCRRRHLAGRDSAVRDRERLRRQLALAAPGGTGRAHQAARAAAADAESGGRRRRHGP